MDHGCLSFVFLAFLQRKSICSHNGLHHLILTEVSIYAFQTARIQILKKAGRPSERLVSHDTCRFSRAAEHECVHVREITEASGTEDSEADAEYDAALKEAICGVQAAVTSINEHMETVRYEIEALESEEQLVAE